MREYRAALKIGKCDLCVRDYSTGNVVGRVPAHMSNGLIPVHMNGYVVGYYKDTPLGRMRPVFHGGIATRFVLSKADGEWLVTNRGNGEHGYVSLL